MGRNKIRGRLLVGGLIALFAVVALLWPVHGTAQNKVKKDKQAPEYLELMWPEPPQEPRIKFVDVLSSELDVGRKITFRESFMKTLTGKKVDIAKMYQPRDVAVSDDGKRVYTSDFGQSVVHVFDHEARIMQSWRAERAFGLALDADENIYVVEQEARQIKVFNRGGEVLRTIKHASIIRPTDIAIDRIRQRIYLADPATKASEEHLVRVFDMEGNLLLKIGKAKGTCEGCLYFPTYVAVGKNGDVYVTSTMNARVDVFDMEGNYLRRIGDRGNGYGLFDKPKGVALDAFDNIYVVDSGWSNVQIFNQKGEVLLFFGGRGSYPGLLKNPTGITITKNNKIFVADFLNYRVVQYELVNTKAADSFLVIPAEGEPEPTTAETEEQPVNRAAAATGK